MSEFLTLLPPLLALQQFLEQLPASPQPETIPTTHALNHVLHAPVTAPISLPSFPRSTVDGYAVRAEDTHGATETLPAYLTLIGEIEMGRLPAFTLQAGQCAIIHTGGMMPAGADAVIMIEQTETTQTDEIELFRAVSAGENLLQVGEDVEKGEMIMPAGIRLRPAEIGGLMAVGMAETVVNQQPRIGILSSGDEVIPPGQPLAVGEVYDVNSYTLQALVTQAGGIPNCYPISPDQIESFRTAAHRALAENDLIIFTAGSSVSVRDLTAQTIDELGAPGVLVHGVNVRPGKPTILAVCDGKGVVGLPGNPVSALLIAGIFVLPAIEKLLGLTKKPPPPTVPAQLAINIASQAGREDWVTVQLQDTADGYVAKPIFGKSNLIFTLVRADGLIQLPANANGLEAGAQVLVHLL